VSVLVIQANDQDLGKYAFAIKQLAEGASNSSGTVTLTANVATTTVSAPTAAPGRRIMMFPATANAAAIVAATYVAAADVTKGQFIVHHTNNANSDKTFYWFCVG